MPIHVLDTIDPAALGAQLDGGAESPRSDAARRRRGAPRRAYHRRRHGEG